MLTKIGDMKVLPPGSMKLVVQDDGSAKCEETGIELWAGDFGNDYLKRNQVDWRLRMPFWKRIIDRIGARSVFEMGANAGWNLSAIRRQFPDIQLYGNDINPVAARQSQIAGLNVVCKMDFANELPGPMELVFTAGVLIHIEPEYLKEVMQALIDKSCRWVLAIEYSAEVEERVEYRNHADKCWKRPYGKLYEELGLKLVDFSNAGVGFDNCCAWLMEKK